MGETLLVLDKADGGTRFHDVTEPPATYRELGVDKVQAHRWQKLAAVPDERFEAIVEAHETQRVPVTTASVLRAADEAEWCGHSAEDIRNVPIPSPEERKRAEDRFEAALDRASSYEPLAQRCTGGIEWYTPREIIEAARKALGGIDLDPALCEIAQATVRAGRYFTQEIDGLSQPWRRRVFLNPPYATELVGRFVSKLLALPVFVLANMAGWALSPVVFVMTLLLGKTPQDTTGQRWLANMQAAQERLREQSLRTLYQAEIDVEVHDGPNVVRFWPAAAPVASGMAA